MNTVCFSRLYNLSIFPVHLVWMGITFADSGDYLCQTEGAETGVFHEYLRLFCITDRATLPQQKLQGFISLCREQALS